MTPDTEKKARELAERIAGEKHRARYGHFECDETCAQDREADVKWILPLLTGPGGPWARREALSACEVCWTSSWVPVPPDDPDAQEIIRGTLKGTFARCDNCWNHKRAVEAEAENASLRAEVEELREMEDERTKELQAACADLDTARQRLGEAERLLEEFLRAAPTLNGWLRLGISVEPFAERIRAFLAKPAPEPEKASGERPCRREHPTLSKGYEWTAHLPEGCVATNRETGDAAITGPHADDPVTGEDFCGKPASDPIHWEAEPVSAETCSGCGKPIKPCLVCDEGIEDALPCTCTDHMNCAPDNWPSARDTESEEK